MTLDFLRTITPFVTFSLMLGLGVIGWFIRRLIAGMAEHISEMRREFRDRLEKIEQGLQRLESARLADFQYVYERFVPKEWYLETAGRTRQTVERLFRKRRGRRKGVSRNRRLRPAG